VVVIIGISYALAELSESDKAANIETHADPAPLCDTREVERS
jgi:hypothetical protein